MPPQVRYARSGDASIAYQVLGGQGPDLVFVPGFASHLDLAWDEPCFARFLRGLSAFSRLIWFDKRGTGLSDPTRCAPTLEAAGEDIDAVLRAVGSTRAVLFGVAVGAAICTVFALQSPQRVRSLILWGAPGCCAPPDTRPAGPWSSWTPCWPGSTRAGPPGPGSRR